MKKSILVLMAAAALASCSESDIQNPVDAKQVDIVLKSSHHAIEVDNSRAPYIGNISEDNPLSARILASNESGDYTSNLHANGNMVFTGVNTLTGYERTSSFTDEMAKFPGTADLFLCGLYPLNGWTLKGTNGATISLDGKTDVMAAAEQKTNKDETANGKVASLTFNHLLTKLEVNIQAETAAAAAYWGEVTGIELVTVKGKLPQNQVEVSLKEATATFSGSGSIDMYSMSGTMEKPGYADVSYAEATPQLMNITKRPVAYAIVAPFETTKDEKVLEFLVKTKYATKGVPVEVALPPFELTNGRAFGINLKFKGNEDVILGTAEVIDWVYSGGADVELGEDEKNNQ